MMKAPVTGLRAWLLQRISAVYMLFFLLFLSAYFVVDPPRSYLAWRNWIAHPVVGILIMGFFAALSLHLWVGLRDVIMDYVKPLALRISVLALLGLGVAAIAAWAARILVMAHA